MSFVAGWRLAAPADLLREAGLILTAVARPLGYDSPFAFRAAVKRARGISPHGYRVTVRGVPCATCSRKREVVRRGCWLVCVRTPLAAPAPPGHGAPTTPTGPESGDSS
jgi:hypothetical protein